MPIHTYLEVEQLPLPTEPLAEAAAVLGKQVGDSIGGRTGPIALQFGNISDRGQRLRAGLDHTLDAALMAFGVAATGSIRGLPGLTEGCGVLSKLIFVSS
jgi:hypothetical protein